MQRRSKERVLCNLGLDSKLRDGELLGLRVRDRCHGAHVANRAMVMQQKTHRPVQFEITPTTRESFEARIREVG
jgi:hypothetical protein